MNFYRNCFRLEVPIIYMTGLFRNVKNMIKFVIYLVNLSRPLERNPEEEEEIV